MNPNSSIGTNTLYYELECPHCGKAVHSGIGFRAGTVNQLSYHLGQSLKWDGPNCRPATRPPGGNLQTIGYFNCDNPRCDTWKDCFPEVQEALITIRDDVLKDARVISHKPDEHTFDIVEPQEV